MLALAIVGATTVVLVAVLSLGAALVLRQRVIGAADAAALAAADAASGAVAGVPCGLAAQVAAANRAALGGCALDGLVATVTVSASVRGAVRSRRGPRRVRRREASYLSRPAIFCANDRVMARACPTVASLSKRAESTRSFPGTRSCTT